MAATILFVACALLVRTVWSAHTFPTNAYNVENDYCPHQQFIQMLNRVDDNGALLRYEVDLFKAPPAAKHRGAIFPCYNLAYTSDAEQWDGLRDAANVEKLKKLNQQCYFNVGVCKEHDRPPSETSEESKHAKEGKESIKIFVPSNVPYVKKLFSNEQVGRCTTECEYVYPPSGSYTSDANNILHLTAEAWLDAISNHDGVLFPFDWSYGSMSAAVPSLEKKGLFKLKQEKNQVWVAFSEEDVFDPNAGRPELWSNSTLMGLMDLRSTYDYATADIPFNLYKFHFWGPCTVNMYFRFVSFRQFDSSLPLVSYASRNCRPNRDKIVASIMEHLKVASIGKCMNNAPWPFRKASYPYWQEKILALQNYKFNLAIQGYDHGSLISEKLYDAFAAGTVPIFHGVSRVLVESFAPSPDSFLHTSDFSSIEELTHFINEAGHNEETYNTFHRWRRAGVNKQFCSLLQTNINSIACRTCEKVKLEKNIREGGHENAMRNTAMSETERILNTLNNSTVVLAIMIRSSNNDAGAKRREAIRKTWANEIRSNPHVRFFFLITSSTPFSGQQDGLQRENAEYGDMLIAPSTFVFVDDGNFISFGHMNATIWCMKEIMSKIDDFWYLYVASDNVYLEAASLVDQLSQLNRLFAFYVGTVNEAITGETVVTDRAVVSKDAYPLNTLPPYALDSHYMLSIDNVRFIVNNLKHLRALPLEDEGITLTLWLLGLQVHPENHEMFKAFGKCEYDEDGKNVNEREGVLSLSHLTDVDMYYDIYRQGKGTLGRLCKT